MCKWNTLKVGDNLLFCGHDSIGDWTVPCEVLAIKENCAVAISDNGGMLWIDRNTEHFFREVA